MGKTLIDHHCPGCGRHLDEPCCVCGCGWSVDVGPGVASLSNHPYVHKTAPAVTCTPSGPEVDDPMLPQSDKDLVRLEQTRKANATVLKIRRCARREAIRELQDWAEENKWQSASNYIPLKTKLQEMLDG